VNQNKYLLVKYSFSVIGESSFLDILKENDECSGDVFYGSKIFLPFRRKSNLCGIFGMIFLLDYNMRKVLFLLFIVVFSSVQAQKTLKVGVISYKSDKKVKNTYEPIFEYVAKEIGQKLQFETVPEDDLGYHLENQKFDLGVFTIFPYLQAQQHFNGLHVFASHEVKNEMSYHGIILTKKSSGISELNQLVGKHFRFVKPTSTSGFKYPKGIFTESDLDIENNFFEYDFSYNHDQSLDSLIADKVDGIAINESYFLEREDIDQSKFNVLKRYEVPFHAYVFSPNIDPVKQRSIEKVLFNMHKDPKAKSLFNNSLKVTKVIPTDDDHYNLIRRYLSITRIKPTLDLHIKPLGKAAENLQNGSDMLSLIEDKTRRSLMNTKRFSESTGSVNQYDEHILVNLYQVSKDIFHYQVLLNDKLVDEGEDVKEKELTTALNDKIFGSVLSSLPIHADLLYNGTNWFITYGKNDGLTMDKYEFEFFPETPSAFTLPGTEVAEITDLNTKFNPDGRYAKGAKVSIHYLFEKKEQPIEESEGLGTFNIFSPDFWKTHTWDKLGLIIGALLTLISALFGRYLTKRKKEKFKGLLYETNELIKECVGDHYRMENKIIEQKEKISDLLDNGKINENQFLILKNRLADLQSLTDSLQPQDIQLTDNQKEQIESIVADGQITEKEFLKITSILKKRS